MMIAFRQFSFEAAHRLPKVAADHPCSRLHGHSYRVEVHVSAPVDPSTGMVLDFGDLAAVVDPVLGRLDHQTLNDVEGLSNPTSEHLAMWLWDQLGDHLPLAKVVVRETARSGVEYCGRA